MATATDDSVAINHSSIHGVLDMLTEACANGRTEEARTCLEMVESMKTPIPHRGPRKPTSHLQPAFLAALENNHLSTVSLLVDEGFVVNREALGAAIRNQSTAMLQVFLDRGWRVNKRLCSTTARLWSIAGDS